MYLATQAQEVDWPADLLSSGSGLEVLLQLMCVCLLSFQLPLQHLTPALPLGQLGLKSLRAARQLLMQVCYNAPLQDTTADLTTGCWLLFDSAWLVYFDVSSDWCSHRSFDCSPPCMCVCAS